MLKHIFVCIACILAFAGMPLVSEAQQRAGVKESGRASLALRCSYASPESAKDTVDLFYKDGREYKPFFITVMAFVRVYEYRGPLPFVIYRKASEQEIAQRKEQGIRGADLEYVEYAKIPLPAGLRDVGVLIPGDLRTSRPIVFDFDEKVFPLGSMMVLNMTNQPVQFGLAAPKGKENTIAPQVMELPGPGGRWITRPVKSRSVLNIRAAVPAASGWKMVYSSSAIFRETTRSVLFVMPSAKVDSEGTYYLEFRQANVVAKPPPEPKETGEKKTQNDQNNGKGTNKPRRRRV